MRELLDQLAAQRDHILRAVDGLDDEAMGRAVLPSGWSIAQLLAHLAHDDEMFWIDGVISGAERVQQAVAAEANGWALGRDLSGTDALALYRAEIARSDECLATVNLGAAPAWWPQDLFGSWRMKTNGEVLLHVITETAVHAGHLDVVRELIDGHQHLVVD